MKIVNHFEDKDVCVVGGPDLTPEESNRQEKAFGIIHNNIFTLSYHWGAVEQIRGCNSAYRKEAVIRAGGFREDLITNEETELQWRIKKIGGKFIFDKDIIVYHYRRSNIISFLHQHFRYGIGKGTTIRLGLSTLKISNIIALLLIFAPLILVLISLFFDQYLLSFLFLSLFFLSNLILACYSCFHEKKSISLVPFIILGLIVGIYAQSFGQLLGLLNYRP
jgi:cellulose synthase/poly-beta-1,6-N-acetylglucosamine synthase-like glycosyltransferase